MLSKCCSIVELSQHMIGAFTRKAEMGLNSKNSVQSLLSFHLINVKICKTICFLSHNVCETLSSWDINVDFRSSLFVREMLCQDEGLKLEERKCQQDEYRFTAYSLPQVSRALKLLRMIGYRRDTEHDWGW